MNKTLWIGVGIVLIIVVLIFVFRAKPATQIPTNTSTQSLPSTADILFDQDLPTQSADDSISLSQESDIPAPSG